MVSYCSTVQLQGCNACGTRLIYPHVSPRFENRFQEAFTLAVARGDKAMQGAVHVDALDWKTAPWELSTEVPQDELLNRSLFTYLSLRPLLLLRALGVL